MLKSKHLLLVFKKIVFQFFYFSFISVIYYELVDNILKLNTINDNIFLVLEMLFFCYLLFFININFLEKELIIRKRVLSVLLKNALLITVLLFLWPYFNVVFALPLELNFIGYHLLFLLFTLASSLFYLDFINHLQNKSEMVRLIKEKKNFEVELLKSQFTPHFLFNTLNSIYSKCHNTSPEAAIMIYDLSNFMRYLIYDCSTHRVLINREVTMIQDFIKLYKLNYNSQIDIDFIHKLYDENQRIAPMLLLNFVENAFKHSQIGVSKAAYVKIELATDHEFLYFKIKNNKMAIQNKLEKGVGNYNTINRLELDYKDRYKFEVTDLESTYEIYLNIRL